MTNQHGYVHNSPRNHSRKAFTEIKYRNRYSAPDSPPAYILIVAIGKSLEIPTYMSPSRLTLSNPMIETPG